MLQIENTRISDGGSFHRDVATGFAIEQEGTALCYVREGDKTVVRPSDAGTSQKFAGVAFSRSNSLTEANSVVDEEVPAAPGPYTITLMNTPISGEIRIVTSDGTEITEGTPSTGATEYSISDKTITFNVAQAEVTMTISYAYVPSVLQAIQLTGNGPAGGLSSSSLGVIGVVNRGDISTDMFDVKADWSSSLSVKVGANGRFTTGTGTEVPGAVIIEAPSSGNQFLRISLR